MNRESLLWHNFEKSGTVKDYLAYKGELNKENQIKNEVFNKNDVDTEPFKGRLCSEKDNEF